MIATRRHQCRRLTVRGIVQGVGFRPFVYRLATELSLTGGVKNTDQGVVIEIEGHPTVLEVFLRRLKEELPPHADIQAVEQQQLSYQGRSDFQIWPSAVTGELTTAQILPDLATCPSCLQDVLAQGNRRAGYPFTNCTHCGPRYSIIQSLPYDRPHTTMAAFKQCPDCQAEYADPMNRRFHAQPNACPVCGPQLEFWADGVPQVEGALACAIATLQQGKILALKGLGGFQLLVDARNSKAVARLRQRKGRPDKPLAVMCSSLDQAHRHCAVSESAAALLTSAQAPVVMLRKPQLSSLAPNIAPENPYLGVMLPTTPLHHLLLKQLPTPVVATSGNRSGEPICTDIQTARQQLGAIADAFLAHNRPIQRPVDDSVVQLVNHQPQVLRHARGYAPQTIQLAEPVSDETCILALGGHLKSAIALAQGRQVTLSQYIGDLDTPQTQQRLQQTVTDFLALYGGQPTAIACDRHPDYASTRLAQTLSERWHVPLIPVQHHYAHVLSGMAEHRLHAPVLGVTWDGTGYGADGTIWGGEFLHVTEAGCDRAAHWLPFPLPGGDACSREPRRSALGLLYACYGADAFEMHDLAPLQAFSPSQLTVLRQMLCSKINTPMTTSIGRLFDGIAALLDQHAQTSFEGQAAMAMEFLAARVPDADPYPLMISGGSPHIIDWRPMLRAIVWGIRRGVPSDHIAARFHQTLVMSIESIAQRVGVPQVMLTGGCFQNRYLCDRTIQRLSSAFTPYWHQRIPTNDGGIAVGQVLASVRHLSTRGEYTCA
ncbi:MAG: carbamoyltransferase HypF [Cyanobacteria bacterium J06627_15]